MTKFAGRVRNIYFSFDIESDTSFSVANEMVFELDITNQDVHKIADMIDGEISSLVPDWQKGYLLSEEESPHHENNNGYCQGCEPNGSRINYKNNPSKNALNCSRNHCGAAIHGRFEEITYHEGSETEGEGAPVVSSQSDGLQYSDIWAHHEIGTSECQSCTEDEHVEREAEKGVKLSVLEETETSDDYENEIRQELRWLKAKYQMELRELRDKQLGLASKASTMNIKDKSASATALRKHKDDDLLKSFASGTHFISFSLNDGETEECENTSFEDLFPQPLNRAISLPVDAIDA